MEMIDSKELADLRRKARCWDDMMHTQSMAREAPDDSEWKRVAREEGHIAGIKACRAALGCGLLEARSCVDAYLRNRR